MIFGLPSLRVKGFYLVMATLAAQFIIPWFTRNAFPEVLNGAQGLNVQVPVLFGFEFNTPQRYLYLTLTVLISATIVAHNVSRSRLGRAFVAIRDNDLAAELLGVNLFANTSSRLSSWPPSLPALAGSLAAHNIRHMNSETFNLIDSVIFLGMLMVGGLGSNLGPIFGAIVVEVLIEGATLFGPFFISLFPSTARGRGTGVASSVLWH